MGKFRFTMISAASDFACGLTGVAVGAQEYDQTFLSDYSKLQATPLPNNAGTDLVRTAGRLRAASQVQCHHGRRARSADQRHIRL